MKSAEFEVMYRVEDAHWWYVGLHRLLLAWIDRVARGRRLRVLDAGSGTGRFLSLLSAHDARGVEIAPDALAFAARRGLTGVVAGSVTALPFPDASFDVVVSADVLSDLGAPGDAAAVAEMARVLAPGGVLLLHLPAFPFLRGEHDLAVGLARRYRRSDVRALLGGANLAVRRLTYRMAFLFPVAAPLRVATRVRRRPALASRSDLWLLPGPLNRLLAGVVFAENRLILSGIDLPLGMSLFAVAAKDG